MQKPLYFIALVPEPEIRDQVRDLKEEMKERFGAKHALKSPAHITLQKPFRRPEDMEAEIVQELEKLASKQQPFTVPLKDFGAFPPRVIFVKAENHDPVQQLHENLKKVLSDQFDFTPKEIQTEVHPHMTIATRDLSKSAFHKAWPKFEQRAYEAAFHVKSLFLLKHNSKSWDIYKEFSFEEA